mmetsp:Transcript_39470/g.60700  ORF Transcript_39470/g.60700 Transcript_39470/m.60700 type:complete len:109 (-) Transcript_39470:239-565(-)
MLKLVEIKTCSPEMFLLLPSRSHSPLQLSPTDIVARSAKVRKTKTCCTRLDTGVIFCTPLSLSLEYRSGIAIHLGSLRGLSPSPNVASSTQDGSGASWSCCSSVKSIP